MSDILKHILVDVHCEQCGDFTVGADVILESQRLLEKGCPGSPYECPPTLFAALLPKSALETLERAWSNVQSVAKSPVRLVSFDDASSVGAHPRRTPEMRAIARWEDDGGYVPPAVIRELGHRCSLAAREESCTNHRSRQVAREGRPIPRGDTRSHQASRGSSPSSGTSVSRVRSGGVS